MEEQDNNNEPTAWLKWARKLQALSQTGLYFANSQYDIERYHEIQEMVREMFATQTNLPYQEFLAYQEKNFGYATPKVDVRGVVIQNNKILLVKEIADEGRWTLPGGWADINDTPSEAVEREIKEEAGYLAYAHRLLAVYDREKQQQKPPFPVHVYKMFFHCEVEDEMERQHQHETSQVAFFGRDELPELSSSRVNFYQICKMFELVDQPMAPTDFD